MAKWLTILTVMIAVIWGGWWVFGAQAVERSLLAAVQAARQDGWRIDYADLSVSGFPSRFDTTVTAPQVTTPDGAIAGSAPFLQVFALAYRPNHVIAVAPPQMAVEVPGDVIDVTNGDLRASVVVSASTQPVLDRSILTGETLRIAVADLWAEVARAQVSTRQAGSDATHDLAVALTRIDLSPALQAALDPSGQLPGQIDSLTMDATLTLSDAPGVGRTPVLDAVSLTRAALTWGETRATLAGDIGIGPGGRASGALTLSLRGWEPLLAAVQAQGVLTTAQATILGAGVAGLVNADGAAQVPVTLDAGRIRVLGLPVAVLPPI